MAITQHFQKTSALFTLSKKKNKKIKAGKERKPNPIESPIYFNPI